MNFINTFVPKNAFLANAEQFYADFSLIPFVQIQQNL